MAGRIEKLWLRLETDVAVCVGWRQLLTADPEGRRPGMLRQCTDWGLDTTEHQTNLDSNLRILETTWVTNCCRELMSKDEG